MKKIVFAIAIALLAVTLTACDEKTSVEDALVSAGQGIGGLIGGAKAGYDEHKNSENVPAQPATPPGDRFTLGFDWPDTAGRAAEANAINTETQANRPYLEAATAMRVEQLANPEVQQAFRQSQVDAFNAESEVTLKLASVKIGIAQAGLDTANAQARILGADAAVAESNVSLVEAQNDALAQNAATMARIAMVKTNLANEAMEADISRQNSITATIVVGILLAVAVTAVFLYNRANPRIVTAKSGPWTFAATPAALQTGKPLNALHSGLAGVATALAEQPGQVTQADPNIIQYQVSETTTLFKVLTLAMAAKLQARTRVLEKEEK